VTKSSGEPTDESDEETILKQWEKEILEVEGAEERVQKLEDQLRLDARLKARRERLRRRYPPRATLNGTPLL